MNRNVTVTVALAAFALCAWLTGGAPSIDPALAAPGDLASMPSTNGAGSHQSIDINSASLKELRSLPGIGAVYAKRITDNRPYRTVDELHTRKVLPKGTYQKIQDKVVATGR